MNAQVQTDADSVTINSLIDRLDAMPVGATGSFVQKQTREFPYSGRYEPSYTAECQAFAQKAAWSLYSAVVEAYYKLAEKQMPSVRHVLNNNAGAYAIAPLRSLIQMYNLQGGSGGTPARAPLPVFEIYMCTRVDGAEHSDRNVMTIKYEGEVYIRRVS